MFHSNKGDICGRVLIHNVGSSLVLERNCTSDCWSWQKRRLESYTTKDWWFKLWRGVADIRPTNGVSGAVSICLYNCYFLLKFTRAKYQFLTDSRRVYISLTWFHNMILLIDAWQRVIWLNWIFCLDLLFVIISNCFNYCNHAMYVFLFV